MTLKSDIAVFTICSKNYIAYARTLLKSVENNHSEIDRYLFLADKIDEVFEPKDESFEIKEADKLRIDNFIEMAFKYDVLEFNTAIKPFCIDYLFKMGYKKVIYFDPDIYVFKRIDRVIELLDNYSIVLTPHITKPHLPGDNLTPSEREHLLSGTYNLGFIAVANTQITSDFVNWWSNKCQEECFSEQESGLFVDQKWINLVPGLFDSVYILRDPGFNMSYWNLHERKLDGFLVNGNSPLIFYHFSGINIDEINSISKYQNRYTLSERNDLNDIFSMYKEKLLENGYELCKNWNYVYGKFDNGHPIGPITRRLYSLVSECYKEPFEVGRHSYYNFILKKGILETGIIIKLSSEEIDSKAAIINKGLKILLKIIGPQKYFALMKYLRYITVLRRQSFLLKNHLGE